MARLDIHAGRGGHGIDAVKHLQFIFLGNQLSYRYELNVGIAEVFTAVRIGAFHDFGHNVRALSAVRAPRAERKVLDQIEHLDEVDASGAGGRHGENLEVAIEPVDRITPHGFIRGKVLQRHQAALGDQRIHDGLGGGTGVKAVAAFFRDALQGGGQIRLHETLTDSVRLSVILEENRLGSFLEAALAVGRQKGPLKSRFDEEAIAGKANGGSHQFIEGDRPESLMSGE